MKPKHIIVASVCLLLTPFLYLVAPRWITATVYVIRIMLEWAWAALVSIVDTVAYIVS